MHQGATITPSIHIRNHQTPQPAEVHSGVMEFPKSQQGWTTLISGRIFFQRKGKTEKILQWDLCKRQSTKVRIQRGLLFHIPTDKQTSFHSNMFSTCRIEKSILCCTF
uniref:Uncharacterized protein n=1 Tax=Micrurus spixii TaxID=129469 RepID=A0A2D4MJC9_9SAUR